MRTFFLLLFFTLPLLAQEQTEVFVVSYTLKGNTFNFSTATNISENAGYDNQPAFYDQNNLLYTRTVDSLTQICCFNLRSRQTRMVNTPNKAKEYSPQRLPNCDKVTAVKEQRGLQRLTSYDFATGEVLKQLYDGQVGYYSFYDEHTFIASVIEGNKMNLYAAHKGKDTLLLRNVGRSLHKAPRPSMMSYSLPNEMQNYDVYLLDVNTYESLFVCELPVGVQDYAWLDEDRLIIGSRNQLFIYDTFGDQEWQNIATFKDTLIENISRIAVAPDGKTLAFAATLNEGK